MPGAGVAETGGRERVWGFVFVAGILFPIREWTARAQWYRLVGSGKWQNNRAKRWSKNHGQIPFDSGMAAMQHCRMISIPVSKRGTITLPPEMRRRLGLDAAEHPMMLAELKDGGVFLQPAEALPVREIPEETLRAWIAEDEQDAAKFWRKAGKA